MSAIACANCGGVGESSLATVYCARCYATLRNENARLATQCAELVRKWEVEAAVVDTWHSYAGAFQRNCACELEAVLGASAVLRTPRSWRIISELPPYSGLRCKICDAPFDSCICIVSPYKDSGELWGVKYELKRARDLLKKALSAFQGSDVLPAENAALAALAREKEE